MARKPRGRKRAADPASAEAAPNGKSAGKLSEKQFQELLEPLQAELVAMQEWVVATGAKIVIVFEGRDTAGKGGVIKRITERVSPRVFRVVALPAPSDREKSQMYIQRYLPHLPAGGEVVIFDRSWYNRAGVERVMGFTPEREVQWFLDQVPGGGEGDRGLRDHPAQVLARGQSASSRRNASRAASRTHARSGSSARWTWRPTPSGTSTRPRATRCCATTHTAWAPWFVAVTDDKKRGRLNIISHILRQIPYEHIEHKSVRLPKRKVVEVPPPAGAFVAVEEAY